MKVHLFAVGAALLLSAPSYAMLSAPAHYYRADFQTRTITGKVTNAAGEPLEGVTVAGKAAGQGSAVTNKEGRYTVDLPSGTQILVFSFVGQESQEVTIGDRTSVDVQLKQLDNTLDDVVVIGYGIQKKINLTGSVGSVSGSTLTKRPAPNSTNLLQGRITGLTINQNTSEPGKDGGAIVIRGRSSFNSNSSGPLILIDGVTGNLNNVSPDDIENVTVLKDASSAAIYGARAANGVILVTTKKGKKGETVINYRLNVSSQNATQLPDFIHSSAEYMTLYNQAIDNQRASGTPLKFNTAEIEKYRTSTDRNQYPNFDHVDYYFNPALVTNHNLSFSGGTDKSSFNISTSFLNQDALIPGYNLKRYNGLINYTNKINKFITLGTSVNLTYKNRTEPPFSGENIMLAIFAASPLYGPYLPDGSGRIVTKAYSLQGTNRNPSEMYAMGSQNTKEYNLNGQVSLDIQLLKNLVWSSKAALNYVDEYYKMYQHGYNTYLLQERDAVSGDYKLSNQYGADIPGVVDQYAKTLQPTTYTTLNYNTEIGDGHNVRVLAGYEQIYNKFNSLRGYRRTGVSQNITELQGYSTTNEALYFSYPRLPGITAPFEWGLRSFFGRINYDYKGKYLLEMNIRRDGTSKVSPEFRWGTFPSISAGWLVSKEKFIEDKFSWLTNLKLRGSYGELGNQDIGTYLYQDVLNVTATYPFDNQGPATGALLAGYKDRSIRWESTRIFDLGLDASISNGLLGITFDWFNKYTYNILATPLIPGSIGLAAPTINNGKLRNRGIELELTHQNRIGQVSYGLNFLISTYRNKVIDLLIPDISSINTKQIGLPYNEYLLYQFDGIVQANETPLPHSLVPAGLKPGDIKMKDVSGPNGKPDGQITAADRVIVKGAYPTYSYSFGGNVDYKNWGLSFFFQGVEGIKNRVTGWGVDPFNQGSSPTTDWRDAWTPQNPSNTMPAIYISGYNNISQYNGSTYFLKNSSYLRLKNVLLSYTLPKSVYSKIKAKDLSVFISADNLITFTQFKNGDPERANYSTGDTNSPSTNFAQYPQTRILNAGLNVKF